MPFSYRYNGSDEDDDPSTLTIDLGPADGNNPHVLGVRLDLDDCNGVGGRVVIDAADVLKLCEILRELRERAMQWNSDCATGKAA